MNFISGSSSVLCPFLEVHYIDDKVGNIVKVNIKISIGTYSKV